MNAEELTAEEREWLDSICDESTIKLLRLYDAALARADKAEQNMNAIGESWRKPCERAESALAEATALLGEAGNCMGLDAVDMCERISAFLSRTPAPAAKAEQ